MTEKESPEKLLLKVLRVADLLTRAETRQRPTMDGIKDSRKSEKLQEPCVEHTQN
jgi:hypothetical protein